MKGILERLCLDFHNQKQSSRVQRTVHSTSSRMFAIRTIQVRSNAKASARYKILMLQHLPPWFVKWTFLSNPIRKNSQSDQGLCKLPSSSQEQLKRQLNMHRISNAKHLFPTQFVNQPVDQEIRDLSWLQTSATWLLSPTMILKFNAFVLNYNVGTEIRRTKRQKNKRLGAS